MKTYIMTEQCFAGSVTIAVNTYGVRAETFPEAKDKLRKLLNEKGAEITHETEEELKYSIVGGVGGTSGALRNHELTLLCEP